MKDRLANNIRTLRKECGLTQEQLSEAINVSAGVISKWELGISTPELGALMELADFFEVSVDVLLGYQPQSKSKERFLCSLKQCKHDKNTEMPVQEVEKHLKKYPNDFELVYHSAELYALKGIETNSKQFHQRALELYEQACRLISQNTDSKISTTLICVNIAQIYRSLDQHKKAVDLLKKNNPCGVNNAHIGEILASISESKEAEEYLSHAMLKILSEQFCVAAGMVNIYDHSGNYPAVIKAVEWIQTVIEASKRPSNSCYMDKVLSRFMVCRAFAYSQLSDLAAAKKELRQAKQLAQQFDRSPSYDANRIRFVTTAEGTAYDDFGITALNSVEHMVLLQNSSTFSSIWEEIMNEQEIVPID